LVSADATIVTVGGAISGAAIGWALAMMLVAVLNGVFDPPPAELAVPAHLTTPSAL
jgi:putative ABC transport system permease protein